MLRQSSPHSIPRVCRSMRAIALLPTEREKELIARSEALYYKHLTIVRSEDGIREVLAFIDSASREAVCDQLKNRLTVGRLLAVAQLNRRESRGTHYREDFPNTSAALANRTVLYRGSGGAVSIC